jgi:hypothetical protein
MKTGLFCACAPCLRPLLRKIAPGLMSSAPQTLSNTARSKNISGIHSSRPRFQVRRGRDDEAFELQSEPYMGLSGKGVISNDIWVGKEECSETRHASTNREGSEKVLSRSSLDVGGITKTVEISGSENLVDDENSIKKFEHV